MSLRRRLVVGLLAVAVALVITNVVLSRTFESVLLDRVDQQLIDVASQPIFGGVRGGPRRGPRPGPGPDPSESQTLSEYFIAVTNADVSGFVQLNSAFADENEVPPRLNRTELLEHMTQSDEEARPFTVRAAAGAGRWRMIALEASGGGMTVVGVSLGELRGTVGRIRVVQVAGTLVVLAALGLVSWWMLRLGVHPVENMARTADAIAGGDLSQRIEHPSERTEAGRLGVALNSMLARIEEAFRAREASEARLRRFAADASHELRTPLTSIQGYAELWRAGGLRDDGELAEAMRRMEQEARRMGALVEDMLLLARLDQHRPLERELVRLDEIAADAVRDAGVVEPGRRITLDAEPASIEGDELALRQVVGNLLANARDHTPTAAPVTVSVRSAGDRAFLEVADDGPGMSQEVAAKVFERFYRADPSRGRAAGGSGLGLSIVAGVAEAMGGSASVITEHGRGSRFVIELPLVIADSPTS